MLKVTMKDGQVLIFASTDGGGIEVDDPNGYEVAFQDMTGKTLFIYQKDIDYVTDAYNRITHNWGNPYFPHHPLHNPS